MVSHKNNSKSRNREQTKHSKNNDILPRYSNSAQRDAKQEESLLLLLAIDNFCYVLLHWMLSIYTCYYILK